MLLSCLLEGRGFLTRQEVLVRSLDKCTSRDLWLDTTSTPVPLSRILVLSEINHLLSRLHIDAEVIIYKIRCSTSSSLFVRCFTTAVLSANFTIWQLGCLALQQSKWEGAQHTALGWAKAEGHGGGECVVNPDSLRFVQVQDPVPDRGTQSNRRELLSRSVRWWCWRSRRNPGRADGWRNFCSPCGWALCGLLMRRHQWWIGSSNRPTDVGPQGCQWSPSCGSQLTPQSTWWRQMFMLYVCSHSGLAMCSTLGQGQ